MTRTIKWCGQALLYAAFAVLIGLFSRWPTYQHLAPDLALIKLSFIHHGRHLQECRKMTPEELAKLPPNMRAPMQCARERSPVTIEVDVDGLLAHREVAYPTGLSKDGAASVYKRLEIPAGVHRLAVRLKDSPRANGFDFERTETVTIVPAQVLVIDFDAEQGGITLK